MATPFILVVCVTGVFCLTPLALYLFGVSLLTRRDRPTVLSGPWDFVGLVVGLSGFFLVGGALVLALLQSNFRYWMRGNFESLRAAWGQEKLTWLMLAFLYLLGVVGVIALTLAARRRSLVVYNIEPAALEAAVAEVFEYLGRVVERRGNGWHEGGRLLLEVDRFEAGHTATLRWLSPDRVLFQEFERGLREALAHHPSEENPASRWLMATAGGLGAWALCCLGLLFVYVFSGGR